MSWTACTLESINYNCHFCTNNMVLCFHKTWKGTPSSTNSFKIICITGSQKHVFNKLLQKCSTFYVKDTYMLFIKNKYYTILVAFCITLPWDAHGIWTHWFPSLCWKLFNDFNIFWEERYEPVYIKDFSKVAAPNTPPETYTQIIVLAS